MKKENAHSFQSFLLHLLFRLLLAHLLLQLVAIIQFVVSLSPLLLLLVI